MSSHIWNVTRMSTSTVDLAEMAFERAIKEGAEFIHACKFAGYIMESCRQKGGGRGPKRVDRYWKSAARTGNRFATGRNAVNYEAAGRNALSHIAPRLGLADGTYPEVVYDYMQDLAAEEATCQP